MNDLHYALIIGIDRYPGISDLSGARADARAFAEWLQADDGGGLPVENVRLVEAVGEFSTASDATPTHGHVDKALLDVTRAVRVRLDADPDAWEATRLYLYAAGHGFAPLGGEGALWLADAEDQAWSRNIELPLYAQWVTQCALFREVVVLADCCRDRTRDAARGLGPTLDPCPAPFRPGSVAKIVGYGSSRGSPTYEDSVGENSDQKRGYFTRVLIEGLQGAAPIDPTVGAITAATLGGYVRQRVAELTAQKPFPQEAELLGPLGTPVVFGAARVAPPPAVAPAPSGPPLASGSRGAPPPEPTLRVSSSLHALEISVWDTSFKRVARGFGKLEEPLPPGTYEVEFRAGAEVRRVSVELRAGEGTHDVVAPQFAIASAAPVEGASTSFETHRDPAIRASESLRQAPAGQGGLIVMVRTLRGQAADHLDPVGLATLSVVRPDGSDVDAEPGGFTKTLDQGFAIWKGALPPGGYALRTTREGRRRDQALWVAEGWQTLVFVPNTPQGPAPDLASIHMAPLREGWQQFESHVGLALELSLAALRDGRGVVPRDLLNLLLHAKFVNPMLGIVGGHTMLLQRQPDLELCAKVITNLDRLVPGHPDVVALGARLQLREERSPAPPPPGGVVWPPMLLPGYGALLRLDADEPGVIADGSPAEQAAATLIVNGVWSAWQPPVARRPDEVAGPPRDEAADPAVTRVEEYIRRFASVHDLGRANALEHVSERQVCLATGLPTATVRRAMAAVGAELRQPA